MERTTRVLVATGVLVGGTLAAWTLRNPTSMPEPALGSAPIALLQTDAAPRSATPYYPRDGRLAARQAPVAVHAGSLDFQIEPNSQPAPAPAPGWHADAPFTPLASDRPSPFGQAELEAPVIVQARKAAPVEHQIRDGDTLYSLAEKYLGDGQRYLEIYQENRHVLPSPEILPIGVVLHMPPEPVYAEAAPPSANISQALVPIPPQAIRRQAAQRP